MTREEPIISLWQPWANWVALGWKTIETRTHRRFQSLAGQRIGIHAALKYDMDADYQALPFLTAEQHAQTGRFLKIGGAVICTALVKEFRELGRADSAAALIDCGGIKRYGLILDELETIEAIPAKGHQGIWYLQ